MGNEMYGLVIGLIVGSVTSSWLVILLFATIHGLLAALWTALRKPTLKQAEIIANMPEGQRAYAMSIRPFLEGGSEGLFLLIAGTLVYGVRAALA